MRVLVIADQESPWFWDHFQKEKLEGIDLILSCGDLKPQYLSFLATFSACPVLYIHGNHDENYSTTPPEGCICIEDTIYTYKGVRILGLGGCMRYKTGPHQYTEADMSRRVRRLLPRLWQKKGFDVLLTHAPAWQLNDGTDLPHMGFKGLPAAHGALSSQLFYPRSCPPGLPERISPPLGLPGHHRGQRL